MFKNNQEIHREEKQIIMPKSSKKQRDTDEKKINSSASTKCWRQC